MCKPCHYAIVLVEAVQPFKLHPTSISYINAVWGPSYVVDGHSCTLTPLPPQMFQRLVTMFRWNPRWCKCVNHGTIMVETVEPYKLHPISISYIAGVWAPSSVVDWHIHMAAQAHHHHHRCFKDSGELSEILSNVRVQTMPLHYGWGCITFQTASHIHILHIKGVICCRWAYGCTSTLLPPQLFPKIRDNSWLKS